MMARSRQHRQAATTRMGRPQLRIPPSANDPHLRRSLSVRIAAIFAGLGVGLLGFLSIAAPGFGEHSASSDTAIPIRAESGNASSLGDLALLAPEGSSGSDMARMNLLAARGLPGAEDLNLAKSLAELDRWAAHVKRETDRHLYKFNADPTNFENSEGYFRILMLITVLQQDLGVHYNLDRINEPDFANSKDLFIHGMIGDDNGGTCVSMPVLTVAVGRRLGYPLSLVVTKGHVFARWDAPDHPVPTLRGRFNVECASRGLHTYKDEHYANWPYKLSDAEKDNGWYLRSLTAAEEAAVFLMQRGHCLADSGRVEEAKTAYRLAMQLAPKSEASAFLAGLSPSAALPAREHDAVADMLAQRHRQEYIERLMEQQRQRIRDSGFNLPAHGGPSGSPRPAIPETFVIPGLSGGDN
jgi:hypothetical protein